jgi:hypothetical protein
VTACLRSRSRFGDLEELQERGAAGENAVARPGDGAAVRAGRHDGVGGNGGFLLRLDESKVYGPPPDPIVPAHDMPAMWRSDGGSVGRRADGRVGKKCGKRRRSGRELAVVDEAEFTSSYDCPVIKALVWKSPDVPLYLFLGGAVGTVGVPRAMADLSGRPTLTPCCSRRPGGGSLAAVASWFTTWPGRSGS